MFENIFAPINTGFATLFSPLNAFSPMISLLLLSSFLTILVLVITRFFVNTKVLREIKQEMEKIREQLSAAQKSGDKQLQNEFLSKMMQANNKYMQHSFKAVIVSIIVLSLFLPYLKYKYEGAVIARLPFTVPFIGNSLTWLYWYILVSFMIGWVARKALGMDYA
jgi:uncharacterized membrane protein (DUF106 family)